MAGDHFVNKYVKNPLVEDLEKAIDALDKFLKEEPEDGETNIEHLKYEVKSKLSAVCMTIYSSKSKYDFVDLHHYKLSKGKKDRKW